MRQEGTYTNERANFQNAVRNIVGAGNGSGKDHTKRSIVGNGFYVGEGIMRWENSFISLDHVETVSKYIHQPETSLSGPLALLIIGIIMLPLAFLFLSVKAVGVFILILVLGGIMIALGIRMMCRHTQKPCLYYIVIRLGSGYQTSVTSYSEEFIDEIIKVIEQCINDRNGVYQVLLNDGVIQYSEGNSISSIGEASVSWEKVYTAPREPQGMPKPEEHPQSTDVNVKTDVNELSENDWTQLGKFLIRRIADYTSGQEEYEIIEKLMSYAGERDKARTRMFIQQMGNETRRNVFGKMQSQEEKEKILTILRKILH